MNQKNNEWSVSQKGVENDSMLTFEEACAYLKVSKSFLYKSTSDRSIPFYKPSGGKMLRFKKLDLDQWLQQNRFPTKGELSAPNNIHGGTK